MKVWGTGSCAVFLDSCTQVLSERGMSGTTAPPNILPLLRSMTAGPRLLFCHSLQLHLVDVDGSREESEVIVFDL